MAIDTSAIDAVLARIHAAREATAGGLGTIVAPAKAASRGASGVDFGTLVRDAIRGADQAQKDAAALGVRFQRGDPAVGLEDTMIAVQKANLSLQQIVQVRNRVVAAYHDIMNMPI
ncbi:MAG: flagellar hook-basal body complex protein FliE [Burkholderiales bacterium]|nr:flagellar hook-basal body complex protein FliE [Burkholderiales bacterium]MCE7877518.1 flagellar hook-basal body complex protein FliE [Betaproteobacteria bacterium PRO3]